MPASLHLPECEYRLWQRFVAGRGGDVGERTNILLAMILQRLDMFGKKPEDPPTPLHRYLPHLADKEELDAMITEAEEQAEEDDRIKAEVEEAKQVAQRHAAKSSSDTTLE